MPSCHALSTNTCRSFPAPRSRPGSARPFSASMTNGTSAHVDPYTHDPAYASPGSTWSPNSTQPSPGSTGLRSQGGPGGAPGRPGSARTGNSFKAYNDHYYRLPKRTGALQTAPRVGSRGWMSEGMGGHRCVPIPGWMCRKSRPFFHADPGHLTFHDRQMGGCKASAC